MAHQPASESTSSTRSGYGKVLKDFVLGGTSGAIAKTLAAPIERVKLLHQTQMNNPKLAQRPYTGAETFIKVSWTASCVASKRKELSPSGEATGPMWSDTSPPKPSTSPPRTIFTKFSSKTWVAIPKKENTSPCLSFLVVLLGPSVLSSSIPSISQEPDWVLTSEKGQENVSSTVSSTAVRKSSRKTALRAFTRDSQFQSWESSPTELSISGIQCLTQRLRFRKDLYLGIRGGSEACPSFCKIPVRPSHHFYIWDSGLPARHNQEKTDDGERKDYIE